jgi:serine/threonine protein kinase
MPMLAKSLAVKRSRTLEAQRVLKRPILPKRCATDSLHNSGQLQNDAIIYHYPKDIDVRRVTSEQWAVRKQAFNGAMQDGVRLLKQMEKQIFFSAKCRTGSLPNISVPEVYGIKVPEYELDSALSVDMEYIPFSDAKTIMLERDKATNDWMIEAAIDLVNYNLSQSTLTELVNILPEFKKKAASIKSALGNSKLVSATECENICRQLDSILDFFNEKSDILAPIGFCHGDLTLANMLIDPENRELCVFDFLDCFVVGILGLHSMLADFKQESPLQDIAKLLQDASHQWFMT